MFAVTMVMLLLVGVQAGIINPLICKLDMWQSKVEITPINF